MALKRGREMGNQRALGRRLPIRIHQLRSGYAYAPNRPGHGLTLSQAARQDWARPQVSQAHELGVAPPTPASQRR